MSENVLTRKEQGEQTKLAILDAARNLFLSNSYSSVSTNKIAEEASHIAEERGYYKKTISKASIFNHFLSKDNLAMEVSSALVTQMATEIRDLRSDDLEPMALLKEFITYSIKFILDHPKISIFFIEITSLVMAQGEEDSYQAELPNKELFQDEKSHKELAKSKSESFMESFSIMMNEFSEVMAQLDLKNPSSLETKTLLLFGMIDGIAFHLYFRNISKDDVLVTDLIDEMMEIVENWIKKT